MKSIGIDHSRLIVSIRQVRRSQLSEVNAMTEEEANERIFDLIRAGITELRRRRKILRTQFRCKTFFDPDLELRVPEGIRLRYLEPTDFSRQFCQPIYDEQEGKGVRTLNTAFLNTHFLFFDAYETLRARLNGALKGDKQDGSAKETLNSMYRAEFRYRLEDSFIIYAEVANFVEPEFASYWLAGWAALMTKLYPKDLRALLGSTEGPFTQFRRELPSQAFEWLQSQDSVDWLSKDGKGKDFRNTAARNIRALFGRPKEEVSREAHEEAHGEGVLDLLIPDEERSSAFDDPSAVLDAALRKEEESARARRLLSRLTDRERELLQLKNQYPKRTLKEYGDMMGVATGTVGKWSKSIENKWKEAA